MPIPYEPLDSAISEIRWLILYPEENFDSPIRCDLVQGPIGDYTKLSSGIYEWSTGDKWWEDLNPATGRMEWSHDRLEPLNEVRGGLRKLFGKSKSRPPPDERRINWTVAYEALSYTWGDASVTRTIDISGFQVEVTLNLYLALKHLRKKDRQRTLWVDAVCINQDDLEERREQVNRMRAIYQRASNVIVWLGDASPSSDLALSTLEQLGGKQSDLDKFIFPTATWLGPQYDLFLWRGEIREENRKARDAFIQSLDLSGPQNLSEQQWIALKELCSRPWWKRMWIIQEVSNARRIELVCGGRSIGWSTLEYMWFNPKLRTDKGQLKRLQDIVTDVASLVTERSLCRSPTRAFGLERNDTTFLNLLGSYRSYHSTDPRDKVYALLGIPSVHSSLPIEPDYTKSVCQVYCMTAKTIIFYTRSLDILTICNSDTEQKNHGLPSWVPDWTIEPDAAEMMDMSVLFGERGKASKERAAEGPGIKPGPRCRLGGPNDMNISVDKVQTKRTYNGLVSRPSQSRNSISYLDIETLTLKGLEWDTVISLGQEIPISAFATDEWKTIVKSWLSLGLEQDPETHPLLQGRWPLVGYWNTLLRSQIYKPRGVSIEGVIPLYQQLFLIWSGYVPRSTLERDDAGELLQRYNDSLRENLRGWRMCFTGRGRPAMVPNRAQAGDLICVLFGGDWPFVLRPEVKVLEGKTPTRSISRSGSVKADPGLRCQLIGNAFHTEIMEGQILDMPKSSQAKPRTFVLV